MRNVIVTNVEPLPKNLEFRTVRVRVRRPHSTKLAFGMCDQVSSRKPKVAAVKRWQ